MKALINKQAMKYVYLFFYVKWKSEIPCEICLEIKWNMTWNTLNRMWSKENKYNMVLNKSRNVAINKYNHNENGVNINSMWNVFM